MRSPQIERASFISDEKKARYSDLKVMQSAAGWYVGTSYLSEYGPPDEPGSRDTEYFATREEAQACLDNLEAVPEEEPDDTLDEIPILRLHP